MARRKFLFLQGMATPFFKQLALAIRNKGHAVYRVNFCGGDQWFSMGLNSWRFNQHVEQLPGWLAAKHHTHQFTDVVLFGDTRPLHRAALKWVREQSKPIRTHVFEEGYLRPHWITLEQEGVNGYSSLLQQPVTFWQQPATANEVSEKFSHSLAARAWHDIKYHLANTVLYPFYHHYKTHRPYNACYEYAGWIKRMPVNKLWHAKHNDQLINQLIKEKTPYYLLPLQLDADSQIRVHSPYKNVEHAMRTVIASFAGHAPAHSKLLIKNHPLATGLVNHRKQAAHLAKEFGVTGRVVFLEAGDLPKLLQHTRGTVLVNSTTGTSALFHGSPTCALGTAIFDLPGLTFQHGLDRFWTEGQPPDQDLYHSFRQAVIQHTQINGDFYTKAGIATAIRGSLQRMGIADITEHPGAAEAELIPPPVYSGQLPVADNAYLYKQQ